MRTRFIVTAACIALTASFGATGIARAGEQMAVTAKKVNKKRKARKQVKRYLDSATWTNIQPSSTGSSITTMIAFCAFGGYTYVRTNNAIVGASTTGYEGDWTVTSANPKTTSARITYTVENFHSTYFDGRPTGEVAPPSPSIFNVVIDSKRRAHFNGVEFNRGPLAGC